MTFISRIYNFRVICEYLNSRASMLVVFKANGDSLLARTLNSRGNKFANIREIKVLANISELTVFPSAHRLYSRSLHSYKQMMSVHHKKNLKGPTC